MVGGELVIYHEQFTDFFRLLDIYLNPVSERLF
jgi:hypothetical protein